MLAHGSPITHLPQKLEKHHQPAKRGDRSLRLAQFHFFSAPKSGNFPVHCFVLLGVSFNQLKLNRVRAKQCYSISEFRFSLRAFPTASPRLHRVGSFSCLRISVVSLSWWRLPDTNQDVRVQTALIL